MAVVLCSCESDNKECVKAKAMMPGRAPKSKLDCDVSGTQILDGVAEALEHFVVQADKVAKRGKNCSVFDGGGNEALITIRDYLYHIANAGLCSKECFVIAIVYAERLLQRKEAGFVITRKNVHRFMLVSIMVASKVLDDFYCRNMYYAQTGGMSMTILNEMELKLCFMLDFELQIQPDEFALYRDSLRRDDVKTSVYVGTSPMSPPPVLQSIEQGQFWMVSIPAQPSIPASCGVAVQQLLSQPTAHGNDVWGMHRGCNRAQAHGQHWAMPSSKHVSHPRLSCQQKTREVDTRTYGHVDPRSVSTMDAYTTAAMVKYSDGIQQKYNAVAPVSYDRLAHMCKPGMFHGLNHSAFQPQPVHIGWQM